MKNDVLILHGALGSASQLEPVRATLETSGCSVHSMDFSGHGGVAFVDQFGIEQFAADVLQWLDKNSISKVDIFGYSMGGYVTLWVAHEHPERVDSIVTLGTKFDWNVESASHEVKKMNPEKILEKIPAFARILEKRHAPNDWKELMQKTSSMMLGLGEKPLLTPEVFNSIENPTLICLGDQDDMADRQYSEDVAKCLPGGKFLSLENTPHPIEKVSLSKLISILTRAFH